MAADVAKEPPAGPPPVLEIAAVAAIFLAPLYAWPGFLYDGVRLPAVLAVVTLLFGWECVRLARRREYRVRKDPLRTAAFAFLGANFLSFFGATSGWEGAIPFFTVFAGVAVYVVIAGGMLPRLPTAAAALWTILAVGLVFVTIGLVQAACGTDAVSTEGNTNYSGTLAAMLLPPAWAMAWTGGRLRRILAAATAAGLAALLLASHSRGGVAGVAAGLGIVAIAMAARRRWAVVGATAGLVGVIFVVPFVFQPENTGRMGTVSVRLWLWKGAARMAAARPVLGWGPGQFAVEYPRYRTVEEFQESNRGRWPDFAEAEDAHSTWAQMAAETGALGLLTFLMVLYVAFRLWRYYIRETEDDSLALLLAGLGSGAAVYAVSGLFNTLTHHASHTVLFWGFLGLVERMGNPRPRVRHQQAGEGVVAAYLGVALLAAFATYGVALVGWMGHELKAGMNSAKAEDRIKIFQEAIRLHPPYWTMNYELGNVFRALGRRQEASDAYRAALRFRPYHVGALNNMAELSTNAEDAREFLLRAIKTAPYFNISYYNLALLEGREKNYGAARDLFRQAIEREAGHALSHYGLGAACYEDGDVAGALAAWRRARELGFDVAGALRADGSKAADDPRCAW